METLQKTQREIKKEATQVNPAKIMEVGMAFWASKTLLTAVNMGLFTYLAKGPVSGLEIMLELSLHKRNLYDFLDTLVALGFLKREGLKETSIYCNADDANIFLDKNKPSYMGGILKMANNRLFGFWNDLEEGLKTGLPQNEAKNGNNDFFEAIYASEDRLREFVAAMGGIQMGNFIAFANKFDFSAYNTLCDIGGAGAHLAAQVVTNNKHMVCDSFDLPAVELIARENMKNMGLADKVIIQSGDFLKDDFPKADIITMGSVLHDWGIEEKKMLIKKAYNALPQGGAFVAIENIIDNDRSKNAFGLMMSLNMLIETPGGFDYTAADIEGWVKEAGFSKTSLMPLTGPTSAFIAIK